MNLAVLCLTELLKNTAGFFAAVFLLNKFFGYTLQIKKAAFAAAVPLATVASLLPFAVMGETDAAADICDVLTMLGFVGFPYLCFKSKKKLTFLWYGIILNSTSDFAVLLLSVIFGERSVIVNNIQYIAIYLISVIAVTVLTGRRVFLSSENFFEKIPTVVYIVILIADLSTYYAVSLTRESGYIESVANFLLVMSAVLVVSCIAFIVYKYFSASQKQQNIQMLLDSQVLHNEEIMKNSSDIRRFRHDYINNIFALSVLMDQNRIEEAKEYLAGMNDIPVLTKNKFATGNYLADAIITGKAVAAQEKGLKIEFEGTIPSHGINNNDICTILANALDNAVFNSPPNSGCPITVNSSEQSNGFVLTISNPVAGRVEIKNNRIKTSKKDKVNHGFGIENIKKVAGEYNGFVNLTCDDNLFIIEIGLMFKGDISYEKSTQIFE